MTKLAELKYNIKIFTDRKGTKSFEDLALEVFKFQVDHNSLYREYCSLLGISINRINRIEDIPFLPISFFKTHEIISGSWTAEFVFESSGTTGPTTSRHLVEDLSWYHEMSASGFREFYGDPGDYVIFALLPGYLERSTSSLVQMVHHFSESGASDLGGFYLDDFGKLRADLKQVIDSGKKSILIGVSFALLDFAELSHGLKLDQVLVMETGGMKGRRKEIIREELQSLLKEGFKVNKIHSEYGMTELLSQAYSTRNGLFMPVRTMKVLPGSVTDPLSLERFDTQATIKVIDLANVATCSFIATEDMGRVFSDGSFQVLGRLDQSDVRGCNLMYVD